MRNDYREALFHDDPRAHSHVNGKVVYSDEQGGATSTPTSGGNGGFGDYSGGSTDRPFEGLSDEELINAYYSGDLVDTPDGPKTVTKSALTKEASARGKTTTQIQQIIDDKPTSAEQKANQPGGQAPKQLTDTQIAASAATGVIQEADAVRLWVEKNGGTEQAAITAINAMIARNTNRDGNLNASFTKAAVAEAGTAAASLDAAGVGTDPSLYGAPGTSAGATTAYAVTNNPTIQQANAEGLGGGSTIGGGGGGGGGASNDPTPSTPLTEADIRKLVKAGLMELDEAKRILAGLYEGKDQRLYQNAVNEVEALAQTPTTPTQADLFGIGDTPYNLNLDTFGTPRPFELNDGQEIDALYPGADTPIGQFGQESPGLYEGFHLASGGEGDVMPRVSGVTVNNQNFQGNQLGEILRARGVTNVGNDYLSQLEALNQSLALQQKIQSENPNMTAGQANAAAQAYLQAITGASSPSMEAYQSLNQPIDEVYPSTQAMADGGSMMTPEEILMMGARTGRVYAMAGEDPDKPLVNPPKQERITVQPMAEGGTIDIGNPYQIGSYSGPVHSGPRPPSNRSSFQPGQQLYGSTTIGGQAAYRRYKQQRREQALKQLTAQRMAEAAKRERRRLGGQSPYPQGADPLSEIMMLLGGDQTPGYGPDEMAGAAQFGIIEARRRGIDLAQAGIDPIFYGMSVSPNHPMAVPGLNTPAA